MDRLKIDNQLCFALYIASKEIVRKYQPLLDKFDLTYTQYITMMALWEQKEINVKRLGEILYLDSGTLTPILKKLECKEYITRKRDSNDERILIVTVTEKGNELKKHVKDVPLQVAGCVNLTENEGQELHDLLWKLNRMLTCKG